ncbi:hypothetical protein D1Y84_02880 [Acidipila sp. EB88]|nr:hypothetical protein D1Y84_02880 [Acidipila sp. EB88]
MGGDVQDVYVEQLNQHGEARVVAADGSVHWQPLTHEHERIKVRGGSDVELDVQRTAHGPIISALLGSLPLDQAQTQNRVYSVHWNIYDTRAAGLPLYALNTATDWTSFRAALSTWWAPSLNVAYADDAGHIGYQAVGLIPIRAGGLQSAPITPGVTRAAPPQPVVSPLAPEALNGSPTPQSAAQTTPGAPQPASEMWEAPQPGTSTVPTQPAPSTPPAVIGEWTGYIPFEAMPAVLDPASGIVATANARVSPDGYPYQLSLDWAAPYRNERIWKQLTGAQALTPAAMLRLQTDVFSEVDQEIAERLAYAVDHAAHPTARARAAADLLRSWDGVLATNSPAAAIVTATEKAFWPAVLEAKVGDGWKLYDWSESAYAREQMIAHQPAAWLPPAYRNWNDFLAALVDGGLKDAPAKLSTWHYGDTHTIAIEHPLWKLLPGFHAGIGPLPQSGDPTTVKQVSGELGPSQRFTAVLGDLDQSTENIVAGESEDPASPYYRNQWPAWYGGTTFTLPYSAAAVAAAAQHTLLLVP